MRARRTSPARRSIAPPRMAAEIAAIRAQVEEAGNRCTDSTGLLGCFFEGGSATCLGDAAATIGSTLVGATFAP